ncbi:MAG: hypothetical protein IDH49_08770 [Gammaproteobacteria bacterium]|nr:hypothetical protein [Gammaproteobacteria bacterium]
MELNHIQTIPETLISMLPAIGVSFIATFAWLAFCRRLYRTEERAWRESIASPHNESALSLDQRITLSETRLKIARSGSPVDRLFFTGLTIAASLFLLYLAAWFVGVAPASEKEREFINMLEHSSFSHDPHIKAVVAIVNDSIYISRYDYLMAEQAFTEMPVAK